MITHELWGQHLRAGNFLFKYAATVAICDVMNTTASYPDYYLWKYLNNKPTIHTEEPQVDVFVKPTQWEWTQDEKYRIYGLDYTKNIQFSLDFFFQSYKWFKGNEFTVYKSLMFDTEHTQKVRDKYRHLFDKECVGISVRRGDFVNHSTFYQIPISFYTNALRDFFGDSYNVVVFSDDIEECKRIFKGNNFFYAEPNNTHTHADNFKHYHGDASEQLILGSLMDNFIIGNSTFSWWQAWLATYFHGKVIHSGKVFNPNGPMGNVNTEDYYHPKWILYDNFK